MKSKYQKYYTNTTTPYQSVFMETFVKDLWKAINKISKLLKSKNINFTIIGGAARNQYGYIKTTEDIDLLVDIKDKEKMLNLPIGHIKELSNKRGKRFKLHDPDTKIDVIYSGEKAGSNIVGLEYKTPDLLSQEIHNVPFLTLEALIQYKLSAGIYGHARYKDFDDIYQLIIKNHLPLNFANNFREDLKEKYKKIWNQTQKNHDED